MSRSKQSKSFLSLAVWIHEKNMLTNDVNLRLNGAIQQGMKKINKQWLTEQGQTTIAPLL
jgi:hypothetical protein